MFAPCFSKTEIDLTPFVEQAASNGVWNLLSTQSGSTYPVLKIRSAISGES